MRTMARGTVMRHAAFALLLASALLAPLACSTQTECDKVCRRVSRCRQEARVGKKMLGERDLPADDRCMKRCQEEPEVWESCEKAKKTCDGLRLCYGPLR